MNKFFIATIAMGFFLISAQAAGVENKVAVKSKMKPVTLSKTVVVKKPQKSLKQKRYVTSISFENEAPKPVAKHQPKLKKETKKLAKNSSQKNYKAIFCQDGYVVKNKAFCAIAKTKAAPNSLAKKVKGNRSIASNKVLEAKKSGKVVKK